MTWFYYLAAVLLGLAFGSFFNVAIYRLPIDDSLGKRSRCPSCGSLIKWYDNVPVLSFVVLRGRCRNCGDPISWRYPVVEAATALLFALIYWWSISVVPEILDIPAGSAFQPELILGLVLVSVLVIISGVDIMRGIIPNKAILAGLVLLTPTVVALGIYRGEPWRIGAAAATAMAGGAFFLLMGLLYGYLFMRTEGEREDDAVPTGIGMGDVKLMLVTGLALGYFRWYFLIVHVFLAALLGSLALIPLKVLSGKGRKDRIPFGPFLAAGAVVALVGGQQLADFYLRLVR
jgi:leader peptidase (prepilin peptidase)/N-methyltransferase